MKVIYEKNFNLREDLEQRFKDLNVEFCTCYSLAKLNLIKGSKKSDELEIFISKDDTELELIKQSFSRVYSFDKSNLDIDIKRYLTQNSEKEIHSKNSEKYKLDILCIGSSTGGLPVISKILKGVKQTRTIIIICQHVSEEHSQIIKQTLQKSIKGKYETVNKSSELAEGTTYSLSGGRDYEIVLKYGKLYLVPNIKSGEMYHPSFNVLTKSLANIKNINASCIILSGLGDDGSKHLGKLKENKIRVIVQNPDEAVAPYMPSAAIESGNVDHIYSTDQLQNYVMRSIL